MIAQFLYLEFKTLFFFFFNPSCTYASLKGYLLFPSLLLYSLHCASPEAMAPLYL